MPTRTLIFVLSFAAAAPALAGAKPTTVPQSRAAMYRERLIPIGNTEYGMKRATVELQTSTAKKQIRRILAMPNIHIDEQKGELVGHEPRTGVTRTLNSHGRSATTVKLAAGDEFETLRMPIHGEVRIRTRGVVQARVNRTVQTTVAGHAMHLRIGDTLEMPKWGDHLETFDWGNGRKEFKITRPVDGQEQPVMRYTQINK